MTSGIVVALVICDIIIGRIRAYYPEQVESGAGADAAATDVSVQKNGGVPRQSEIPSEDDMC